VLAYHLLFMIGTSEDPTIVERLKAICAFSANAAAAIEFVSYEGFRLYIDPRVGKLLKTDFERGLAFLTAIILHELGHNFFNNNTIVRLYQDAKSHMVVLPSPEKFREDVEPLMEGLVNEYVMASWKLGKKEGIVSYKYGVPFMPLPGVVYIVDRPEYRQFEEYYKPIKNAVEEFAPYFEYHEQQTKCLQNWLSSVIDIDYLRSRIAKSEWGDYEFLGSLPLLSLIPENFRKLIKRIYTEVLGIKEWRFNELPQDMQMEYAKVCNLSPSDLLTLQQENPVVIREVEEAKRLVGKSGTCELWRRKRRLIFCPDVCRGGEEGEKCRKRIIEWPPRPPNLNFSSPQIKRSPCVSLMRLYYLA